MVAPTETIISLAAGGNTDPAAILTRPAPPPDVTLRYGPGSEHVADLRLPPPQAAREATASAPLVLFLHGGFWRAKYDRRHTWPLGAALASAGFAVCTPEFRRVGQPGGGWPGTLDDVAAAVDALPDLAVAAAAPGGLVPRPFVLAGHSAGGHLALWAAARHRLPRGSRWRTPSPGPYRGVVGLAAVSDLAACQAAGLGGGAADALMGGGPARYPYRYALADPAALLPLRARVRLVHGARDEAVPCAMSRDYAARAVGHGDDVLLDELAECGHYEPIDPLTAAWPSVLAALRAITTPSG